MPNVLHLAGESLAHLRRADPVMARLIPMVGAFDLRLKRRRFDTLVRAIIAQQISTAAARSIRARLQAHLGGHITPAALAQARPGELRRAGLSAPKADYLRDLARKVNAGVVRLDHLHRLDDDAIIAELTQIRGIGVWTAQMFLMFCLGRPDVFPHADLGIRTALKNLYRLRALPDRDEAHAIAAPWRPYATVASWYCWRSLELGREQKVAGQWW
jgi:DNA-3-methyladenine glycosylase II